MFLEFEYVLFNGWCSTDYHGRDFVPSVRRHPSLRQKMRQPNMLYKVPPTRRRSWSRVYSICSYDARALGLFTCSCCTPIDPCLDGKGWKLPCRNFVCPFNRFGSFVDLPRSTARTVRHNIAEPEPIQDGSRARDTCYPASVDRPITKWGVNTKALFHTKWYAVLGKESDSIRLLPCEQEAIEASTQARPKVPCPHVPFLWFPRARRKNMPSI